MLGVWNHKKPISRILDPHLPKPPAKYRVVSPTFEASSNDPIVTDTNPAYECDSVFEPVTFHKWSAIPLVLNRWNEKLETNKLTFEWKDQIYKMVRLSESKVINQVEYHKISILYQSDTLISSPSNVTIKVKDWTELCSFYIRIYDDQMPYNGEFYF